MNNNCGSCAFHIQQLTNNVCLLNKQKIDLNGKTCQFFKSIQSIYNCEMCNKQTVEPIIFQLENSVEPKILCAGCAHKSGTCELCEQRFQCEFETNASSLPKTVIKQIRQGIGVIQTEIKNPDRIKETCMKGCPCWDSEEQYCLREIGTCGRYKVCFG